jgi:hypothetical protein
VLSDKLAAALAAAASAPTAPADAGVSAGDYRIVVSAIDADPLVIV